MNARETTYHGHLFRSRLEARWAAFFDLMGWAWLYEPAVELYNYIPDFILQFYKPLLVEVKPEFTLDDLAKHADKIRLSGWDKEFLIVGAGLNPSSNKVAYGGLEGEIVIGLLHERFVDFRGVESWGEVGEGQIFRCDNCGKSSILHAVSSWHCRVCGFHGANNIGLLWVDPIELWGEAHRLTRWTP